MAFKIESASTHHLDAENKYFLDANIWIKILAPPNDPTHKEKLYIDFFEKIIQTENVKIVVPVMLISEVINRIIKDVYFRIFAKKNGHDTPPPNYYKEAFRISKDYIESFGELIDEFKAYSNHIDFVDDGFNNDISQDSVFENIDKYFDFNDNFYYQLALKRNYFIVTDDKDFWREDVTIITENKALLNKNILFILAENAKKKS